MANRDCNGDFFSAEGRRYYRCLWDSAVVLAPEPGAECPNCKREIQGQDEGEAEAVYTQRIARLTSGLRVLLPDA